MNTLVFVLVGAGLTLAFSAWGFAAVGAIAVASTLGGLSFISLVVASFLDYLRSS